MGADREGRGEDVDEVAAVSAALAIRIGGGGAALCGSEVLELVAVGTGGGVRCGTRATGGDVLLMISICLARCLFEPDFPSTGLSNGIPTLAWSALGGAFATASRAFSSVVFVEDIVAPPVEETDPTSLTLPPVSCEDPEPSRERLDKLPEPSLDSLAL